MRKIFILTLVLSMPSFLDAQDLIIRNDGEKTKCKITQEDSTKLYYEFHKNNIQFKASINRDFIISYYYDIDKIKRDFRDSINMHQKYYNCVTIGVLQGGGSLIGADLEIYLINKFGIQFGAGLIGYGLGLNYHIKPKIRSSFISLLYWHQGYQSTYTQSLLGPCYVFRGRRWFTAQIGLGFLLQEGPAWPSSKTHTPVMLTYAIGGYIPW